jgi:hypothetical protein
MLEPIFMKLGMYIVATKPMSTAYFINPSRHSAVVSRQRLGKNVTAASNTHAAIEELLDASSYTESVSYQRKIGDWFFPELLV